MSTSLEIRLWTDPSPERLPFVAFRAMVQALVRMNACRPIFHGLRIKTPGKTTPVAEVAEPLREDDVLRLAQGWDLPGHSIWTKVQIVTEVAEGETTNAKFSMTTIEAHGGQHRGRTGDWWIEGDACIGVDSANPFVSPPGARRTGVRETAVARCVQRITDVTAAVTASLRPVAVKTYTDAGESFPFNAHTAYYADARDLERDLMLIRRLFTEGDASLELPALAGIEGDLRAFVFHLWRGAKEQRRLQAELAALCSRPHRFDAASAYEAVVLGEFAVDSEESASITVASDHDRPFNGFLDGLFIGLLGG